MNLSRFRPFYLCNLPEIIAIFPLHVPMFETEDDEAYVYIVHILSRFSLLYAARAMYSGRI